MGDRGREKEDRGGGRRREEVGGGGRLGEEGRKRDEPPEAPSSGNKHSHRQYILTLVANRDFITEDIEVCVD